VARNLVHASLATVTLQEALDALADPVRRSILRELSGRTGFHPALRVVRPAGVKKRPPATTSPCSAPPGCWSKPTGARARFNRLRREEFDARFSRPARAGAGRGAGLTRRQKSPFSGVWQPAPGSARKWRSVGVALDALPRGPTLFGHLVMRARKPTSNSAYQSVGCGPRDAVVYFAVGARHIAAGMRAATISGVNASVVHPRRDARSAG